MRQTADPRLINLAAGLPSTDSVPKEDLRQATDQVFQEEADAALGYQVPEGDDRLRALLAARLRNRGIQVHPDDLVLTTGCTQAVNGMIELLTTKGDVVACEAPAYYATLEKLGDHGIKVLPIPVSASGVDLHLVSTLFKKYRPKLFVVCSTLSNPSGATISNEARRALLEICRRTQTRILEDEIYGELSETGDLKPIRAFDDGSTVSYATSLSKTVAPGLRVGLCIPGGDLESYARLKCQQDMHSATWCQIVVRKYLEMNRLELHLARLRKMNRERIRLALDVIEEAFPEEAKVWIPNGGYMLWVQFPDYFDIERVYRAALDEGVAFCRSSAFYPDAESEIPGIRINCSRPSAERLVEGLLILGRHLKGTLSTQIGAPK